VAGPARHCLCLKSQIVSVLSVGVCKLALHSRKKTGRVQRIASVRRSKSCGALKWVAKIFEGRAEFVDETVEIIGDEMPAKDYAQIISHVLKRKTTYNHVPREMHSSMGFPGSCELADMFEFLRLHPKPTRSHHAMPIAFLPRCRRLNPG
jgi:hypothetical protein